MTPARIPIVGAATLVASLVSLGTVSAGQDPGAQAALRATLTARAERTVLADRCGECHRSEFEVWQGTPHATGFTTLHRRDSAKEIYQKLGLRLIKRGTEEATPACLQCHYTPVLRDDEQLRAGEGVSCESCHGPARDWITVHNDYGVPEPDFQRAARQETPEHRAMRIAGARAAGMRRPSDLYDVAANCFGCHTVPSEELVNVGGHSTGSNFELVEWSQGEIRHNFLESFKTGDGTLNAERPPDRKRVMYVVGRTLDLEYSLRGVAVATRDDLYLQAMVDRANIAVDNLLDILDRAPLPEVQAMVDLFDSLELSLGHGPAIVEAADRIGEVARTFIARDAGAELASLDPLWDPNAPAVEDVVSRVASARTLEPAAESEPAPAFTPDPTGPGVAPPRASGEPPPPLAEAGAREAPVAGSAGPEVPSLAPGGAASVSPTPDYPVRQRPEWRDEPAHEYVRKVPCGRCHNAQERWWRDDPHSETATPFRRGDDRYAAIADAYGVGSGAMARGDQICMWCHGTVVSNPARDVRFGVGCQRCHGPGADYEEPHEDSYSEALTLGMVDLEEADVRARTCAGCHYITDPGLLAAGHASGSDFDLAERATRIVHWGDAFGGTAVDVPAALLVAAHGRAIAARGPVPTVTRRAAAPAPVSRPPSGRPPRPTARAADAATPAVDGAGGGAREPAAVSAPGAGRRGDESSPVPPGGEVNAVAAADGADAAAVLPPSRENRRAEAGSSESIEGLLLDIKARLEALYRELGR